MTLLVLRSRLSTSMRPDLMLQLDWIELSLLGIVWHKAISCFVLYHKSSLDASLSLLFITRTIEQHGPDVCTLRCNSPALPVVAALYRHLHSCAC